MAVTQDGEGEVEVEGEAGRGRGAAVVWARRARAAAGDGPGGAGAGRAGEWWHKRGGWLQARTPAGLWLCEVRPRGWPRLKGTTASAGKNSSRPARCWREAPRRRRAAATCPQRQRVRRKQSKSPAA